MAAGIYANANSPKQSGSKIYKAQGPDTWMHRKPQERKTMPV